MLQWGRRVNATERVTVVTRLGRLVWLQWGRRVNATERCCIGGHHGEGCLASMGPPRERDGEANGQTAELHAIVLQWGRRVNATERRTSAKPRA